VLFDRQPIKADAGCEISSILGLLGRGSILQR